MFPLFTCFSFAKKKKGDVTSGQRLHHARGVGNKVVLCRSAILCVLCLCYNTSNASSMLYVVFTGVGRIARGMPKNILV